MSDDLIDRLRIVSNMINMGERISWGQDTALMDEAAAELTGLRARIEAADKLADAAEKLTRHAKTACNLGAVVGSHWTHLGIAHMQAASALSAYEEARE